MLKTKTFYDKEKDIATVLLTDRIRYITSYEGPFGTHYLYDELGEFVGVQIENFLENYPKLVQNQVTVVKIPEIEIHLKHWFEKEVKK